ncbi:hypothetical protein KKC45_00790 [Patescibacteria group bacterium]|nr:hypothetical protein [Patescibacteria group bacterium]
MKQISIYIFGDSLVYGQGDTQPGGWVNRLQEKLGTDYGLRNFGVPGDTSKDLLNRIENQLGSSRPNLIIISIGANDTQYSENPNETLISQDQFKKNLEEILQISRNHSAKIIFVGIPQMNDSITTNWHYLHFCNKDILKFNKEIKKFCKENDLQFVDIFGITKPEDLSDGAHPNSSGYEKIMEKIYEDIDF